MRRLTKQLLSTVGLATVAIAGLAASEQYCVFRQRAALEQSLGRLSTEVESLALDPWRGRVTLASIVTVRPDIRMTIGAVDVENPRLAAFSLIDPAAAALAVITAHDIRIEAGNTVLSIPTLEARGMGSSSGDLAGLFDSDSPRPLAERVAKLSGGSISVPELKVTVGADQNGNEEQSFTLHGLLLSDIVGGKIGSLVVERADSTLSSKEGPAKTVSAGRISASAVDVPLGITIAQGSRTEAEGALRPLYEALSINSIHLARSPTEQFEIGAIQSSALSGRPLMVSFKQAADLLNKADSTLSDEDRKQQTTILVDLLKSFSLGRFEIRDVSYEKTGSDDPTTLKLGRLLIDGFETLRSRTVAAEHFMLADKDVRVTFSRSALDGIDGSGLVDVVGSAKGASGIAPTPEQIRRLAPKLADASLLDFRVEAPSADLTGNTNSGKATVFDMPVAEVRIGPFVGNLASTGSSHMQVVYDISSPAPGSGLEALAKAGFGRFDISSDYAADWSQSTQEYRLNQLSLSAKDLASVTTGGTLSNVSADVMSPDKDTAAHAAHQIQLRSFNIGLVDSGLADKGLPLAAASMNLSIPEFKTALNAQAADTIGKLLGPGPQAEQLTAAFARFIDHPKTLDISVRAKEAVSVQSIIDAKDPQEILSKLDISAVANR